MVDKKKEEIKMTRPYTKITRKMNISEICLRNKVKFINYVRIILAIFHLTYPHVRVRKIFQTPPPYSYVRFHFVFQHNKML